MSRPMAIARAGYHAVDRPPFDSLIRSRPVQSLKTFAKRWATVRMAFDGVWADVPVHLQRYYSEGGFGVGTTAWIRDNVAPGETAADIGAHVGIVSLLLARSVGPEGRVWAFEPAAENVRLLKRNIRKHSVRNVTVVPKAVGGTTCERTFQLTGSSDLHGFYGNSGSSTEKVIRVTQVALDDVVTHVDAAKIDVEGAEVEVLQGMTRLIAAHRPRLLVEWSPKNQINAGYERGDLLDLLQAFGYEISVLDDAFDRVISVREAKRLLDADALPQGWYANLACR